MKRILHSNTMPVDVLIESITSNNIPGARLAAATIKYNSSLFFTALDEFASESIDPMVTFWMYFLKMVTVLLTFIRAD